MYAIEFLAEIKERYIEIPEYENFQNSVVKIIILKTEEKLSENKYQYPTLDYKKYIHQINFKVDEGEMTNPFLEVQDTLSYSQELRIKSWRK
ncbi:MAG: hypothetical protein H7A23_00275 [Leptospiraceae bacterium]|nr:hypothetical protein [Leptospiraceae bacterium]MCP5492965.1 hypothetical protein [Leptospiraceae bacterium]